MNINLLTSPVLIPLTQNKFTIIDREDFQKIKQYKWYFLKKNKLDKTGYAGTTIGGRKNKKHLVMHRVILNASKGTFIDHKDRNGLNNQKSNIRFCTPSQNNMNQVMRRHNKVGFKGVILDKDNKNKPYLAYIKVKNKQIRLGYFKTPEEAALAYNNAALKYFGDFANLNKI